MMQHTDCQAKARRYNYFRKNVTKMDFLRLTYDNSVVKTPINILWR